jgi:hypothetical protein
VGLIAVSLGETARAGELAGAPDLTPVRLLQAPKHAPVELARKGQPVAEVYVADRGSSPTRNAPVAGLGYLQWPTLG